MRNLSFKLGVLAALTAVMSAGAAARDLTVVSWGGAYQDAQREVYFKPFMATGIKMAEESWDGGVGTLRAKIQGGNNNWDVVQVESDELLLGCEEGLYEKLDWAKLGGKDKYLPDAVNDCGVGRHRLQLHPRLRRRQDQERRAEVRGPTSATCRSGRASARCARARRRRSRSRCWPTASRPRTSTRRSAPTPASNARSRSSTRSRRSMVWWEKGSQPPQLLASGEVVMTDAYNGRIAAANDKDKKNFKIVWTNNLYTIDSWVIMKGTPNKADAEKYLVFVNDPQNQKNLPSKIPYGVTVRAATPLIDPKVLPELSTAPQNIRPRCTSTTSSGSKISTSSISGSTPGWPSSDPAALRRALRRSERREQLRAAALVLPLFLFLLASFIVPIGSMLARGVADSDVARILPRVTAELARWDGRGASGRRAPSPR